MTRRARAVFLWLSGPCLALLLCAPALAQNSVRGPVQHPVPMQMPDQEGQAAGKSPLAGHSKFPNIDTAKDRQDYEMGTDSGADSIQLGRDKATGDTVMRHPPPKKAQPKGVMDDQQIQVKVLVPTGSYTGTGSGS